MSDDVSLHIKFLLSSTILSAEKGLKQNPFFLLHFSSLIFKFILVFDFQFLFLFLFLTSFFVFCFLFLFLFHFISILMERHPMPLFADGIPFSRPIIPYTCPKGGCGPGMPPTSYDSNKSSLTSIY